MARFGCPRFLPVGCGLVTAVLGLGLWNGLGPYFGLGRSAARVSRTAALASLAVLLAVVVAELIFGGRV